MARLRQIHSPYDCFLGLCLRLLIGTVVNTAVHSLQSFVYNGGEMRDIREDLKERIRVLTLEQERLQKEIAELEGKKNLLGDLLHAEELRWCAVQPASIESPPGAPPAAPVAHRSLRELILDIMSDYDSWSGSMITRIACNRGFRFGASSPGRVVHYTLIGMAKIGWVEQLGQGRWRRILDKNEQHQQSLERVGG